MTETRNTYGADTGTPNPRSLLPYTDPNYQPPNNNDVRMVIKGSPYNGTQIADLLGVSSRHVRRWQSDPSTSNFVQIPYRCWRLLLLETGIWAKPGEAVKKLTNAA